MRLTVCELPDEMARMGAAWTGLLRFLTRNPTDIVVLPEMPFCAWQMFMTKRIDRTAWNEAVTAHDIMMPRLAELNAGAVLGSRPIEKQGVRLNEAFCWTRERGYQGARAKHYLPDEPDGRESTWFARGDRTFEPISIGPVKVGFQICTELFFTEVARRIALGGGQVIAAPRATGGHRRWPTAVSMAAIVSGCFVASSNRRSLDNVAFAGRSWLLSPDGEVLAETSAETPYLTVEIDLEEANRAKETYPRTVVLPETAPG
jgi:N-carbamoylputrescine amidase